LHSVWTGLLVLIAATWIFEIISIARGVASLPRLSEATPVAGADAPRVSILFAARDEAAKLPEALASFLALDYPNCEVIAADDRSSDDTGKILADAARTNAELKCVRIDALPQGWLGKPHGLQQAYERATGEWLVFTDADVSFAPDVVGRALAVALENKWDHLTLLGRIEMYGFFEKIAITFFGFGFVMGTKPWRAHDSKSSAYLGVGAFQLVRRSSYEAMGTHQRLRMEVVDDMKLGKLMKEAGSASGVAMAGESVSVHWHDGVRNVVRGTTKNFFATCGYSVGRVILQSIGLLLMFVFPFCALAFAHGWPLALDVIAAGLAVIAEGAAATELGVTPLWGLSVPIGALIFVWMLVRSTIVTRWQGGIVWRGTFYRLGELKKGMV
jgi:Glycosyl transferase family 2